MTQNINSAITGLFPYAFTVFPIILNHIFTLPWADKANIQSALLSIDEFLAPSSNSIYD